MAASDNDLFSISVSESYQVPPISANEPTLTWHVGLWCPRNVYGPDINNTFYYLKKRERKQEDADDFENRDGSPDRIGLRSDLDTLIVNMFNGLARNEAVTNLNVFPNDSESFEDQIKYVILYKDVYRLEGAGKLKCLIPLEIQDRLDIHTEILENDRKALLLSFTYNDIDYCLRYHIYTEYFVISVFANINRARHDIVGQLVESLHRKAPDTTSNSLRMNLFSKFWNDFAKFIYKNTDARQIVQKAHAFKFVFCDFRGVTLPTQMNHVATPKRGPFSEMGQSDYRKHVAVRLWYKIARMYSKLHGRQSCFVYVGPRSQNDRRIRRYRGSPIPCLCSTSRCIR